MSSFLRMQVGINDNILHLKDANAHISADVCQKNPLKGINHSLGVVGFNTTAANGGCGNLNLDIQI